MHSIQSPDACADRQDIAAAKKLADNFGKYLDDDLAKNIDLAVAATYARVRKNPLVTTKHL